MVNRQSRSPGKVQTLDYNARISDAPSFAVDTGAAWRALADVGSQLSARLGKMADGAAAREGELAGLTAGQRAGVGYLQHQGAIAAATPAGAKGYDLAPHVPKGREAHLAGIRPEFGNALGAMLAAAPDNVRQQITLFSGYRSVERQAELYKEALAKYGSPEAARKWVAPPGNSRHNHGDAYDLQYGSDEAKAWVHANAGKFGLAFPLGNEDWHIELATARGGSAVAATALPAAANAYAGQPLSTTPLALRNDGTIRGEAFDAAATKAWGWRFEAGLTADLGAAYDQFKDDPAGYASAANEITTRYSQDPVLARDPQAREAFDKVVYQKTEAARLDIAARQETRLRNEEVAAVGQGLEAVQRDLERQAYALGANPAADGILAPQLAQAEARISAALEDGLITPAQAAAQHEKLASTVFNGRIQGTFNALQTPGQKEAFALGLMDEWAAGEGPISAMSLDQVKALSNTLFSQARAAQNQLTASQKADATRLSGLITDDLNSMAATGQGLNLDQAGLSIDKVSELLGEAELANWQTARDLARDTWLATSGMELDSAQEIADRLTALQPQQGQLGFTRQVEIFTTAQKRAAELLEERKTDPLAQAHRGGLVELKPIDTSSPEALMESLAARREIGRQVSAAYGNPVTYFRPSERTALTTALYQAPELMPEFALSIVRTFGEDAGIALGEISDAGPELAYAAGVTAALGDNGVISEVSRVIAGRRDKTISVKLPSDAVMTKAAGTVLGSAMGGNPATRAAVVNVAQILFEGQAAALGFDPADIKDETSGAFAAWQQSVDRALGARTINGVKYGGVANINGLQTVAPSSMPADRLQHLVSTLSAEDLAALPPIASGNGISVAAWQLQGAQLVAVGDGQYRVALGDPMGLEPQYVTAADGSYWVLDAAQLDKARQERGSWSGVGRPAPWMVSQ